MFYLEYLSKEKVFVVLLVDENKMLITLIFISLRAELFTLGMGLCNNGRLDPYLLFHQLYKVEICIKRLLPINHIV
jgi:hypothetical protein